MRISAKVSALLSDTEIAVNAGENLGVAVNDVVVVYTATLVRDPDSADLLGTVNRPALRMRVTEVQERLAVARSIEPATSFGRNDNLTLGAILTRGRSVKRLSGKIDDPSEDIVLVRVGSLVVIEVTGETSDETSPVDSPSAGSDEVDSEAR
jgi:hypothetical protein